MVRLQFQSLSWNNWPVALPFPLLEPVIKLSFFIYDISVRLEDKVEAKPKLAIRTNSVVCILFADCV